MDPNQPPAKLSAYPLVLGTDTGTTFVGGPLSLQESSSNTNVNAFNLEFLPGNALSSSNVEYVISLRNNSGGAGQANSLLVFDYDGTAFHDYLEFIYNSGSPYLNVYVPLVLSGSLIQARGTGGLAAYWFDTSSTQASVVPGWMYAGPMFYANVLTTLDLVNYNPNGKGQYWWGHIFGFLTVPVTGNYTFEVDSDDGARLWIGPNLVVDNWVYEGIQSQGSGPKGTVYLVANVPYPIIIDWFNGLGGYGLEVWVDADPGGTGYTPPYILPISWCSWDIGAFWSTIFTMYTGQTVTGFASSNVGSQQYTSPGTYTFTVPQGVYRLFFRLWGAGGGGGGGSAWGASGSYTGGYGGGGGGGGQYLEAWAPVSPGQQITVTVGSGGAGGSGASNSENATGSNGANGGSTSVASGWSFVVGGGGGGAAGPAANVDGGSGGAGGAGATSQDWTIGYVTGNGQSGATGQVGTIFGGGAGGSGGAGGGPFAGGGGAGGAGGTGTANGAAGNAGGSPGGGGGGGGGGGVQTSPSLGGGGGGNGGNGGNGQVTILW